MNYENEKKCKKYYETFVSYKHPVKLTGEISKKTAETRNDTSYYIGHYSNNNLIKVEKILNHQIEYSYLYSYDSNNKLIEVIVKSKDSAPRRFIY
jgi:hypothetical protein